MELEQRLTTLTAKAKDAEDAKGMNSRITPTTKDVDNNGFRLPVTATPTGSGKFFQNRKLASLLVSRILKRFNPGQVR